MLLSASHSQKDQEYYATRDYKSLVQSLVLSKLNFNFLGDNVPLFWKTLQMV